MFSHGLYPEEPNHLVHLPATSHKIERRGMAKTVHGLGLGGYAEEEMVDPAHSILSVDTRLGTIQMNKGD
jgi:hypothetical protein